MHLIINYNYKCTYNICRNFRALNFTDYMALNSNYSNCIKCKVLIYGIYIFFKISKDIWHHQKVNLQTLYIQRVFSRVSQNLKKKWANLFALVFFSFFFFCYQRHKYTYLKANNVGQNRAMYFCTVKVIAKTRELDHCKIKTTKHTVIFLVNLKFNF